MKSRVALEVDDVQAALDAARAEAVKNGWAVSISVVDDGGHPLGFLRLTEAAPLSAQIAFGKARTAAISRRESKFYEDVVKNGRTAFLSVSDFTTLEGGGPRHRRWPLRGSGGRFRRQIGPGRADRQRRSAGDTRTREPVE